MKSNHKMNCEKSKDIQALLTIIYKFRIQIFTIKNMSLELGFELSYQM